MNVHARSVGGSLTEYAFQSMVNIWRSTAASDSTIRKSSDALLLRRSDAEVSQDRDSGVDRVRSVQQPVAFAVSFFVRSKVKSIAHGRPVNSSPSCEG